MRAASQCFLQCSVKMCSFWFHWGCCHCTMAEIAEGSSWAEPSEEKLRPWVASLIYSQLCCVLLSLTESASLPSLVALGEILIFYKENNPGSKIWQLKREGLNIIFIWEKLIVLFFS